MYCVLASRYDVMHNKQKRFAFISSSLLVFVVVVVFHFFLFYTFRPCEAEHSTTFSYSNSECNLSMG